MTYKELEEACQAKCAGKNEDPAEFQIASDIYDEIRQLIGYWSTFNGARVKRNAELPNGTYRFLMKDEL